MTTRVYRRRAEHDEQQALVEWYDRVAPGRGWPPTLHAIPNGGGRGKADAGRLKAEGVRAGYPDLGLDAARGGFHGLRIEMKRADRREPGARPGTVRILREYPTPEQRDWIARLEAEGFRAVVCRGFEEARAEIRGYLEMENPA